MARKKEGYYVAKSTGSESGFAMYYGIKEDVPDTAPFYTTNQQAATAFKSLKAARIVRQKMNHEAGKKCHWVEKITIKKLN